MTGDADGRALLHMGITFTVYTVGSQHEMTKLACDGEMDRTTEWVEQEQHVTCEACRAVLAADPPLVDPDEFMAEFADPTVLEDDRRIPVIPLVPQAIFWRSSPRRKR